MSVERLVGMANDIGNFFAAEPLRDDQVAGVHNHLQKFWDQRMRRQIVEYARGGGGGLSEHVRAAVLMLDAPRT